MKLPLALVVATAGAALAGAASVKPKRGFVADGCSGDACPDSLLLNNSAWFYDYNTYNPYDNTSIARFVPMHWCLSGLNASIPANVNTTFMMGFNEPNNAHNCNTDAATVAAAWGTVMARWPTSLLVSPATAGNGIPWFDAFFDACKSLYPAGGCRVDALAVHDYSCDPQSTMSYLSEVHSRYGNLPIWLTEFSCGDGAAGNPTPQHVAFMKAIVPLLDAAPFVARYAWMSARDKAGKRGLVAVGPDGAAQLTELGQLWQTL